MSISRQSESSDPAHAGQTRGRGRLWWLVGLGIAAAIVVILAPLASPDPDGLESVAGSQGWLESARDAIYQVLPDYTIPGIDDPVLSTIIAGLVGVAIVFLVMVGLGRLLRRRSKT